MIVSIKIECSAKEANDLMAAIGIDSKIELSVETLRDIKDIQHLNTHDMLNWLMELTCEVMNVSKHEMESRTSTGKGSNGHISEARKFYTYFALRYTTAKLKEIGWMQGNRDHSTIISQNEGALILLAEIKNEFSEKVFKMERYLEAKGHKKLKNLPV